MKKRRGGNLLFRSMMSHRKRVTLRAKIRVAKGELFQHYLKKTRPKRLTTRKIMKKAKRMIFMTSNLKWSIEGKMPRKCCHL
jgi:hypothetical protein